jgi:hypothetical protein
MKNRTIQAFAITAAALALLAVMAVAAQDKNSVKAANGVGFAEFKGYESWETVAVSETDNEIKTILANPVMMKAYKEGVPGNGKPFPEGSMTVKIAWTKKPNDESPYAVSVPGKLDSISFILKDSKRFPDSSGYGYAQFLYDAATDTFTPFGKDASFNKTCYQCHTIVKAKDYIFTAYPKR